MACPLLLGAMLVSSLASAQSSRPVEEEKKTEAPARHLLRDAIDLYVAGRYRQAASRLGPLVRDRILSDKADHLEALRIYGITLYLSGSKPGAERTFRDLLRLDPAARLDPSFARPEVVGFFEQVRVRLSREMQEEARKRGPRGSAIVNLLPPWGQFQNSHHAKGYLVLAGEVALIAASLTTAGLLYSWRSDTGEFEDEDAYNTASVINIVSLIGLGALLIYGAIDGLYYYYRGPRPAGDNSVSSSLPTTFRF